MNPLRYLENRIRGWLPKAPTSPHPQRKNAIGEHLKLPAKPDVTTIPDRRLQLNSGILIGLGAGLILVGFLGWLTVNSTYKTLQNFFSAGGLDANYFLFKNLLDQMAAYLTVIAAGAYGLLFGTITLKSSAAKRFFSRKGPYYRLGGGLMGGGGTLAIFSQHSLFSYILTSDYVQLQIFSALFLIGVSLLACGIVALSIRPKMSVDS
jgi:hypothetical protein